MLKIRFWKNDWEKYMKQKKDNVPTGFIISVSKTFTNAQFLTKPRIDRILLQPKMKYIGGHGWGSVLFGWTALTSQKNPRGLCTSVFDNRPSVHTGSVTSTLFIFHGRCEVAYWMRRNGVFSVRFGRSVVI